MPAVHVACGDGDRRPERGIRLDGIHERAVAPAEQDVDALAGGRETLGAGSIGAHSVLRRLGAGRGEFTRSTDYGIFLNKNFCHGAAQGIRGEITAAGSQFTARPSLALAFR